MGFLEEEYSDYRDLLHAWFWLHKAQNPRFSFRSVARRLGLRSPNHFHLVTSKQRHLSKPLLNKLLKIMNLSSVERHYVELLFSATTETDAANRARLVQALEPSRQRARERDLTESRYELVANTLAWHIKMAAVIFDGKALHEIVAMIRGACLFPVEEGAIAAAFALLQQLALVSIDSENVCHFDMANVMTKWDFSRFEIKQHHENMLQLALQSVPLPIDNRFFSSVTIPCDTETYQAMIGDIRSLCLKYLDISTARINNANQCRVVSTLHFSLFPFFRFAEPEMLRSV